ncbi:hypothetical protein [Natrinema sp. CBA1119]|uniref:hypothetical protein n=1 Tax=Natrinema sp. CBA1119 TaxID=1608465 RepID=UPI000BF31C38|nr:hypothetical protein [Natrinema sp. CBA1119]
MTRLRIRVSTVIPTVTAAFTPWVRKRRPVTGAAALITDPFRKTDMTPTAVPDGEYVDSLSVRSA